MNKIDKEHYKYLKVLSQIPRDKYDKFSTNIKIKGYMEGVIWKELLDLGYVNSNPDIKWVVTKTGLEQLRMLEDMRRKDLTLYFSLIALFISVIAILVSAFPFAKSMGWI